MVAKRCTHAVVTLLVHMVNMWLLRGVHMQWLLVHDGHVAAKRCTHAVVTHVLLSALELSN